MKQRESITFNRRYSACIRHMDDTVSALAKEKPIERIRTLEQKINEVNKISDIENSVNRLKEELWARKEVLSSSEVCAFLGISESHLYRLTSTKQIPHYRPNGKMIYFNRKELCEWALRNPAKAEDSSPAPNKAAL